MRGRWLSGLIPGALALLAPGMLCGEVTTYNDEAAFLNELLRLGYTTVEEGFEDDGAWGSVRSTIVGGQMTASSVTSQGITWTHNFAENPVNQITTGPGPARTGAYGFFCLPHGNYYSGNPCTVPGACGDGFKGSVAPGAPLYAVGGWVTCNLGKLGVFLDGSTTSVDFSNSSLSGYKFFGVIDTAGFTAFEFRELEGVIDDAKIIFADDFTFGLAAAGCGSNDPPTAAFVFSQTDAEVMFTDGSSDTDGTIRQWLWDFGDGTFSAEVNPTHTYLDNGTYSVVLRVRDDGQCIGESAPQMIIVSSYPAPAIGITTPVSGTTVSGTIDVEVSITSPSSSVEQVKYYEVVGGNDVFFEKSEAAPFGVMWDTTILADGVRTIRARMTKFDETEIWSDPVTVTVANAPAPTPLETWRAGYFSAMDLADALKEDTVWGDLADADGDGNWNWKEYVFGGNPLDPTDVNLHMSAGVTGDGGGGVVLAMTYRQRTNDPALSYVPQVSSDMSVWSSGAGNVEVLISVPLDAEFREVTFKDVRPGVMTERTFGNILVTSP